MQTAMFFIWLVMPMNVGKQHLPSQMNRRLCGCDKLVAFWIAMVSQLAIQVRGSYFTNALQKTLQ